MPTSTFRRKGVKVFVHNTVKRMDGSDIPLNLIAVTFKPSGISEQPFVHDYHLNEKLLRPFLTKQLSN